MEPGIPPPLEQIIIGLVNSGQPLVNSELSELTNLQAAEMDHFKSAWLTISPERRREIVRRLAELADDNVELNFDGIFKYCLNDSDDEVRSMAIEGLWENEEPSMIEPLIELMEQDSSEKVQAEAAMAMGKFAIMAEDKKLRPTYTERIKQALLAAINDKKRPVEVRRRALESISPLGIPEVKTAIDEAYRSSDPELVTSSVYAMGKNCDPSWLPVLLKEMASTDARMRYEAAGACGEMEEEEAVPGLKQLAGDSDVDVQMAAIQALGKIGNTEAQECLKKYLESESEAIRQTAQQALEEIAAREDPLSFKL